LPKLAVFLTDNIGIHDTGDVCLWTISALDNTDKLICWSLLSLSKRSAVSVWKTRHAITAWQTWPCSWMAALRQTSSDMAGRQHGNHKQGRADRRVVIRPRANRWNESLLSHLFINSRNSLLELFRRWSCSGS